MKHAHLHIPSAAGEAFFAVSGVKVSLVKYLDLHTSNQGAFFDDMLEVHADQGIHFNNYTQVTQATTISEVYEKYVVHVQGNCYTGHRSWWVLVGQHWASNNHLFIQQANTGLPIVCHHLARVILDLGRLDVKDHAHRLQHLCKQKGNPVECNKVIIESWRALPLVTTPSDALMHPPQKGKAGRHMGTQVLRQLHSVDRPAEQKHCKLPRFRAAHMQTRTYQLDGPWGVAQLLDVVDVGLLDGVQRSQCIIQDGDGLQTSRSNPQVVSSCE
eukprot:1136314-Pelagomonas_calceolata.AAC.2